MTITIALDSFKGSLNSMTAGRACAEGILRAIPDATINILPIADGGEGTVVSLADGLGGRFEVVSVSDPLGRKVNATYAIVEDTHIAVMEIAAAAGLTLLTEKERNPYITSTYGVGEMILDAINKGCRNFIIGIGGSATNDGGAGMLQALGFGLLDNDGNHIPRGALGLQMLHTITDTNVPKVIRQCRFNIACDVTNPLLGYNGCSAVFGPQKGATIEMIPILDDCLSKLATIAKIHYPDTYRITGGAGAAGGLGFAFATFLGAELAKGTDIVLRETHLEDYIKNSDIVVTGEGRLDSQTVMGKAPVGVADIAKKYNNTVIAFCGSSTKKAAVCNDYGIDAFFPILRSPCTLDEAMDPIIAYNNMADTAEQVFRLINTIL